MKNSNKKIRINFEPYIYMVINFINFFAVFFMMTTRNQLYVPIFSGVCFQLVTRN